MLQFVTEKEATQQQSTSHSFSVPAAEKGMCVFELWGS